MSIEAVKTVYRSEKVEVDRWGDSNLTIWAHSPVDGGRRDFLELDAKSAMQVIEGLRKALAEIVKENR